MQNHFASKLLLQDVGYVKEAKATEHPGRLDHPKGKICVDSPAVASAENCQIDSALLLMSTTYIRIRGKDFADALAFRGQAGAI